MFSSKHGVDDMVMLSDVSNSSINSNLKKRLEGGIIYTYIGHVLISVNPYKEMKDLYTERTLKDYKGKYRYELPPHVYSLADEMYRAMLSERENHCVIISGESGAGKTEASKKIMQFIAAVSGGSAPVERVKSMILDSNPLLEAFGNAQTLRNNNSSRFGKYMEIQFEITGDPEGGRIRNYLLEKSRVVTRIYGERSFHIFYQLLAGADSTLQQELYLTSPEYFYYLNLSNQYKVDGMDDVKEWNDMLHAMNTMGITPSDQKQVFAVLAAVLYLGNVQFVPGGKGDDSVPSDTSVIDVFSHLIQADSQATTKALCYRTISTGTEGRSARVSVYNCPNSVEGANYSRDALAKALYTRLFDWIVQQVNHALGWQNDPDSLILGILDIYGFEIFDQNGFEQFCINYVNEKLQQIFIQLTLKSEQEEYAREGIKWQDIPFFNNKICCDLIETKRPPGLMALLDDTCNFPKGDDVKFLHKCIEAHSQHAHYIGAAGQAQFTLKHYAGDVVYNVEGFVDKNRDSLFNDLIDLAHCTSSSLVGSLFPEAKTSADKRRPTTAGFKIKTSINELTATLEKSTPHYIRCIKPNEKKKGLDYSSDSGLHQVKYLGLLENVKVRRAGFAYRHTYERFFYRYRVCSTQTFPHWSGDFKSACDVIMQLLNLSPGNGYEKGHTKIFVRQPESVFSLEEMRERKTYSYANQIQRFFLRFSMSNYYYNLQVSANQALLGKKRRRRNSLERPFTTDYLGYRDNLTLKALVESNGKEKLVFSDRVYKYDRRLKVQRRFLLMTDIAIYLISIDKNKDKDKVLRQKKPWIFGEKRRVLLNSDLTGFVFSTLADSFVLLQAKAYDSLFESRRKTELLGCVLKYAPHASISFSDSIVVRINQDPVVTSRLEKLKKSLPKKASFPVTFVQDPVATIPVAKSGRISVPSGLDANTSPNIPKPVEVPTMQSIDPYAGFRSASHAPPSRASPTSRPTPQASQGRERCKALYDFEPENPDELKIATGDVIYVLDKTLGEWWKGELRGQSGIFPSSYVEPMEPEPAPAPTPSPARAPVPVARRPPASGPPSASRPPASRPPASRPPAASSAPPASRPMPTPSRPTPAASRPPSRMPPRGPVPTPRGPSARMPPVAQPPMQRRGPPPSSRGPMPTPPSRRMPPPQQQAPPPGRRGPPVGRQMPQPPIGRSRMPPPPRRAY